MEDILKNKFKNKNAKIAVVGLGYVGLPLAIEIAKSGFEVFGIDISKLKIDYLNSGKSYISDVKEKSIESCINKSFFVGQDFSVISSVDTVIICVPTPLNETKSPELSYVISAVDEIIKYINIGTLIILESTIYPGATEELITNVIKEKLKLEVGNDFFVCYSPERIDPNNKVFNVKNTPKVIGGSSSKCLEIGIAFYESFLESIVPVKSTKVAEMVKLIENTFRSVNIAFINEMTILAETMGINIWDVIDAASTKPYGFMPFYPGPGVGGHCLPIDPVYLSWKAKQENFYNRFIELSSEINSSMSKYTVNQIINILNNEEKTVKNSNILILGLAYKKDVNDLRESPALEIFHILQRKGAHVEYYDPYIPSLKIDDKICYSIELTKRSLQMADIVVIITDHSNIAYQYIIENSKIVYDTRNVTKGYEGENIVLLGGHNKSN